MSPAVTSATVADWRQPAADCADEAVGSANIAGLDINGLDNDGPIVTKLPRRRETVPFLSNNQQLTGSHNMSRTFRQPYVAFCIFQLGLTAGLTVSPVELQFLCYVVSHGSAED